MSEHKTSTEESDVRERNGRSPVASDRAKTVRVICWVIAGVAIYGLRYDLLIFGRLLCGAFLLVATVAIIPMLAGGSITRRGAAVLVCAIVGLYIYGGSAARHARFYVLKSGYEAIVKEAEQGLTEGDRIDQGRSGFYIDDGVPVRVGFPWNGVLDNWCGVVFDPTDELSHVCGDDGLNPEVFVKDPVLRRLFGDKMTYCERLQKGWYFCCFT